MVYIDTLHAIGYVYLHNDLDTVLIVISQQRSGWRIRLAVNNQTIAG